MKFHKTHITGCVLIDHDIHRDARGMFMEISNCDKMTGHIDDSVFYQSNIAISKKDVLRGLHIMKYLPQAKAVSCLAGVILDCVVDLRPESSSYLKWGLFEINSIDRKTIYIPSGCAHGYYSITNSIVHYSCSSVFAKEYDYGLNAFDKSLGIEWPSTNCIMSEKDKNQPDLDTCLNELNKHKVV